MPERSETVSASDAYCGSGGVGSLQDMDPVAHYSIIQPKEVPMSAEQAKAFIERMKTDEAFREKVLAIEEASGRIACIQSEGYDCSPEEVNDVIQDVSGVAAGKCCWWCPSRLH